MKRKMTKAKAKSGKKAVSKLRSRVLKTKTRQKKAPARKTASKARKKPAQAAKPKAVAAVPASKARIVRIMGQGQFTVDAKTLKTLNEIDDAIVALVSQERSDDLEFRKRLAELNEIVVKDGKPLDPHEIIRSDIILPSADLSVDEAKKLFKGEGVIPEV